MRQKITRTILLLLLIPISKIGLSQDASLDEMPPHIVNQLLGQDSLVDHVLTHPDTYRFQFMLTELLEYQSELVLGETHVYRTDDWYFYPASMVKLPIALMTLEKLKATGFTTNATPIFNSEQICGNMSYVDETKKGTLTFHEMLRKLIIVSNNTYYNTLYHYLTPKSINESFVSKGIKGVKIYKDFTGCEMPWNFSSNSLSVKEKDSSKTYVQRASVLELKDFAQQYTYNQRKLLGSKHEYRGKIVEGPYDFNYNLDYSLRDIHATSMRLFFPEIFSEDERWDIRDEDREFLLESMKSVPKDLGEKEFLVKKNYPDNLYKYIALGDANPAYDSVVTYSKIGISYGFVTETAHVINKKTNKQYVLTASIYVNSNDTVNDGKYEYEELARPFLARFGQLLLER